METYQNPDSFIFQYKIMSAKIRKRFLRKPNVAEASEDFSRLACQQKDSEAWAQAGMCYIVVAKCEQTLQNMNTEVTALIEAARNFIKAEKSNKNIICPSYNEHMITAISCYQLGIKIYAEQNKYALAAALGMEIGQSLSDMNEYSEALVFLQESSNYLQKSPIDLITCLNRIASCKISLGDLSGALKVFLEVINIIEEHDHILGALEDIKMKCEIASLLIMLMLQPIPNQHKQKYSKIMNKFASNGTHSNFLEESYGSRELVVLLQSLVIACQSKDLKAINFLDKQLTKMMSGQLLDLLNILITEMKRT